MAKPHKNNPDDFQELKFNKLQRYAKGWVRKYSILQIEKITLYGFDSEYSHKKYALVFLYSGRPDTDAVDIGCPESYPIDGEDSFITALKEIKHANPYTPKGRHRLFNSRFFDNVYKKKPSMENPSINYFRDWMYHLKQHTSSEEQLPRGILKDDPCWILYQRKLRPNQKAKIECIRIAQEMWEFLKINYPDMIAKSKYVAARPELEEVAGAWTVETRRRWISPFGPKDAQAKGKQSRKTIHELDSILNKFRQHKTP